MKAVFRLLFSALILAAVVSCSTRSEKNKIALAAEQMQSELPIDLGQGIVLATIDYDVDDKTLKLSYECDEKLIHVDGLISVRDAQKRFLTNLMASGGGEEFLDMLVEDKSCVMFCYKGLLTGKYGEITFSPDELQTILLRNASVNDERHQLADIVAITNAQCPLEFDGEDMILEQATCSGHFICFSVKYNSEKYNLVERFDDFRSSLVDGARQELNEDTSDLQRRLMRNLGIGYRYNFVPTDSSRTIVIEIPAAELF